MGIGILTKHYIGLNAWQIGGTISWNSYGLAATLVLGLGLSALSVNRANRPVTRYCRHGAAIVMIVHDSRDALRAELLAQPRA